MVLYGIFCVSICTLFPPYSLEVCHLQVHFLSCHCVMDYINSIEPRKLLLFFYNSNENFTGMFEKLPLVLFFISRNNARLYLCFLKLPYFVYKLIENCNNLLIDR